MSDNVWKVGSRWSDTGTKESSIIDIFRKYQIVFLGSVERGRFQNEVKTGDYIAIADGFNVCTISKVLSEPMPITELGIEFTEEEKNRFTFEDWVIGAKVHIVELKNDNNIYYKERGAFCRANQINNEVIQKYDENQKKFEIAASTQYFKDIINSHTKYIIPIYQRPYSWNKEHIDKLLNDLFIGYYNNGVKVFEDVFIGTMQLSFPKRISDTLYEQEIIDGQQRISTFLLLIKVIQLKNIDKKIPEISLDWLSTEVNNNTQEADLKELIAINDINDLKEETNNTYIKNAFYVNQKLESLFATDEESEKDITIGDFLLKYIFEKVCFVVIKTFAPLSKTLKIFDAINTTGMDLGGNDIFKIRFYEYLKDYKNEDKKVFEQISTLYSRIDEINKDGWKFGIYDILSNYQWILISKYGLNKTLYNYNANTFFEQLFDVILKINNHNNFDSTKILSDKIEISIAELNVLIENRNKRESEKDKSIEITCANHLIAHWSRYGRYWQLIMLFYYSFSKTENFEEKLKEFVYELQKTLVVYSVVFDKSVNEMHSFLRDLVDIIIREDVKDYDELIIRLKNKRKERKIDFINTINGDIFHNAKKKNLICRTSAIIDELDNNPNHNPEELGKKIFTTNIDIEHIHSRGDELNSAEKLETWGKDLNSLGNLMILESTINKSISNDPFHAKLKRYPESIYKSVKNMAQNNTDKIEWTFELAMKRKEYEVEKLRKYYF
jgi:hypothetical protein